MRSTTLGRRCNCRRRALRACRRPRVAPQPRPSPCASSARLAAPFTQHYAERRTVLPTSPSHQYRPRASRLGARARRTRSTTTSCRRTPFRAVLPIGSDSHDPNRNAHACHRRRSPGRNPAAHIAASRMGSRTTIQLTRLSGPHIGRQRPLCATVPCEDPEAHSQSEYDGFEAISLCAPQTGIVDQLMPA
jgi:hypothetical protein